jgi:hypothetical protein
MITLTDIEKEELMKTITGGAILRMNETIVPVTCYYCFKRKTASFPDQVCIFYIGETSARWMAKVRKLTQLADRPGTRDECITHHFRYRERIDVYTSWQNLIDDEVMVGTPIEFIEKLQQSRVKHSIKMYE